MWLCAAQHLRKGAAEPQTCLTEHIASYHMIERGAVWFPAWIRDVDFEQDVPNLTSVAQRYLERLGLGVEDLFYHVLAVLHDPAYRRANAGALRMEWPRIPLPGWPELAAAPPTGRGGSRTAPTLAAHADAPAADPSVIPAQDGIQTPADAADSSVVPVKTGTHPSDTPADPADNPANTGAPGAGQSVVPVKTGTHPSDTPADPADNPGNAGAPGADLSVVPVKTGTHPSDAAQTLAASAARGRQLAQLLDSDTPVPGVTTGALRPEIAAVAVPATTDDRNMTGDDFALTAGWGHYGAGEAVMPGQGRAVERAYTTQEREALQSAANDPARSGHSGASRNPADPAGLAQSPADPAGSAHPPADPGGSAQPPADPGGSAQSPAPDSPAAPPAPALETALATLGETTYDIHLNDRAYWQNVPANVWRYKLGGYQVLKKWLSYREQTVLGRPLEPEEVQHFTDTARRIAAILELTHSA